MSKRTTLLLTIICYSTLFVNAEIKEKIYQLLNSDKVINYSINKLTIQGYSTRDKYSVDTLFIHTFSSASFMKMKKDSRFGYEFVLIDSLIHPTFKIPMKTITIYQDAKYITSLTSSMKNSYSKKRISETDPELLSNTLRGHIPDMLYILNNEGTKQLNDTIIKGENCYHFSTQKDSLEHGLFVSTATLHPYMMQVTTNTFQPFIQQYYYNNYSFASKQDVPEIIRAKTATSIKEESIKANDILPEWTLSDLKGNNVSFKKSDKYKVIYLSMINCGPCQKAIPHATKLYNYYNATDDVEFVVFYPLDSKADLEKYVKSKGVLSPVVYNSFSDEKQRLETMVQFNIGYPSVLFIDKDNRVKYILTGYSDDFEQRINRTIEKLRDK